MAITETDKDHTLSAIGDSLVKTYSLRTLIDIDRSFYYSKIEGLYKEKAENIIRRTVREQVNRSISRHDMLEIETYVKDMTRIDRAEFDSDPTMIHVANGWINLTTKEFSPHSPERFSLKKVAASYDPVAKCPAIEKFLREVLEKGDISVAKKLFGYLLLPHNKYKKAFLLIGPKDTAKSTFLALLEAFVGKATHVSLHDLAKRTPTVVTAAYSMLNTTSEIPLYALKDVSLFKNWTGNDEVAVRAIYQPPFNAKFTAKFVLAANDPPNFEGADRTFIERWIVLEFNNIFQGDAIDINIFEKITTPSELAGLLNMALQGLEMLQRDGYFKDETYDEAEARWRMMTSKLAGYLTERTVKSETARVLADKLYDDYCNYCGGKKETPMHNVHFGRELRKAGYQHKQVREGRKRPWFYLGLNLVTCGLGNYQLTRTTLDDNIEGLAELPKPPKTDDPEAAKES